MDTDATKPNIGRIYDYVLGGHHNIEIDRIAAQHILKIFPSYPRWARLNRWFLHLVAEQWAASGHHNILDLGSGMPTQDHLHTLLPDAKVLYTDNDPLTVAYAREILGDNRSVAYLQADIRQPGPILETADRFFGGDRQVAIGCIGMVYFIDDASLINLMRALHDWAAHGSVMALSFIYSSAPMQRTVELTAISKRMDTEFYPRDEMAIRRLVVPWQVRELKPLTTWLAVENLIQESDRAGVDLEMYGALLERGGSRD